MGYTTNFGGELWLSNPLPKNEVKEINEVLTTTRHDHKLLRGNMERPFPSIWNQWIINDSYSTQSLVWDGNEKFYNYIGWLDYIIRNYMIPNDIYLNGRIQWIGEDKNDIGVIYSDDNFIDIEYTQLSELNPNILIWHNITMQQYLKDQHNDTIKIEEYVKNKNHQL